MAQPKHQPTKCIAIDVDGTLIINGRLNQRLVNLAAEKKADGFEVLLWSARGKTHAEKIAKRFGIEDNFSAIISKPGYIIDDLGWTWIKYTRVLSHAR